MCHALMRLRRGNTQQPQKTPLILICCRNSETFNYGGQYFWARGYYVSTVERDEKMIREYIKKQEQHDRKLDQWNLFDRTPQDPS